ncbi:hypothetical protein MMC08_008404 [Hypocenomyce scalaris]|nr:hypothetical protein [Hypocenomyce scalaris]
MAQNQLVPLEAPEVPEPSSPSRNTSEMDPSSRIFTILPVAVQARIPRLTSLRRSISAYSLPLSTPLATPKSHMLIASADSSFAQDILEPKRPPPSDPSSPAPREGGLDTGTGTGWKYANQGTDPLLLGYGETVTLTIAQGLSLLETAVTESQSANPRDQAFARQLYIHALAYLLQGLPNELSDQEAMNLRAALPQIVRQDTRDSIREGSNPKPDSATEPSLLHRLLASGIVQLFLFIQFILPYVKYFFCWAYQYEREHRVSEKLLSSSIDTVEHLGKRSFEVGDALLKIGNGRLGGVVIDTAAWWIEGISGGVHEGVGEGVAILGMRRGQSPVGER